MRYVTAQNLKEGMVLAKPLYDKEHKILLVQGTLINNNYIKRILGLGYQGIYVKDDLSHNIVTKDIICDQIRHEAINSLSRAFISAKNQKITYKENTELMRIKELIESIIDQLLKNDQLIVNLIDLKVFDEYTLYHSVNVAVLSLIIGIEYGLEKDDLCDLGLGAILHDIGKVFLSTELLNKKEKLSSEEISTIREHPSLGGLYLDAVLSVKYCVTECALQHHERYDGKGYPVGLKANSIGLYGRIIAVCDVYDALISNRAYRQALLPSEAMEYVMASGGSHFDPEIVDIFTRKVAPFPVGCTVKLSNGLIGLVAMNYENCCMRPKIKIVRDKNHDIIKPYYIDLRTDLNLINVTIINML